MFQPISPQNLAGFQELVDARTQILAAIETQIGTYTHQSESFPSIWVVKNIDTDPPRHYLRSGLECLIFPPEGFGSPLIGNAMMTELWRIRLIQHDRSKSTLLAYYAMLASFPDCNRVSFFPADRDIHEQLNLSISQTQIVK